VKENFIFQTLISSVGHENIIKFDDRPFITVQEMENTLISNWNSVVKNEDTTYILGDFCWDKEDEWKRILKLLNGNKVLILGNHDLKSMSAELKRMFQDVKDYKEITDNGKHIIMSHYPILFYKSSYNPNCYMLCGHVHTTRENDYLNKWCTELIETKNSNSDNCGNIYNVGCMTPWMNYTPRTLDEIITS
jgi:calcineurin-like phosphoesterase family protein